MMPQSDLPDNDLVPEEAPVQPIPPRYWWLKRIGVVAGILLISLFALRLWWGWEANRRLQAEIDRIIAAGEPIYPEDFDPKEEIPDEQNAARLLIGADELVNLTSEQKEILGEVTGAPELIRERLEEVRGIVEGNAEVFRRLRRARSLSRTDWGMRIRTPAIETSLPSISGQQQLSKLHAVAAPYQHLVGNSNEAVEILCDGLAHAENLRQQPTLISQLVAWAGEARTIQAIEYLLPSLSIRLNNDDSAKGELLANHAQIRSLIVKLSDERGVREGMRRAMLAERMYQVDILKTIRQGTTSMSGLFGWRGPMPVSLPDVVWRHALGPTLTLDVVGVMRQTTQFVEAAGAASFSGVPDFEDDVADESGFRFLLHPLQSNLSGSLERAFVLYFRLLARRRVAAAALAIRLYEVDQGRRPETLAELVPEYLSQIPEDPFAVDGETIRYLPGATHPVVYSIGDDGLDEEGSKKVDWADVPFFLDGWRPEDDTEEEAAATSTKAVENQKSAEEDEGEGDEDESGEEEP